MIFGRKKKVALEPTGGVDSPASPGSPASPASPASPDSPASPASPAPASKSRKNRARRMAPPPSLDETEAVSSAGEGAVVTSNEDVADQNSSAGQIPDEDTPAEDTADEDTEDEVDWAAYDLEQDWRHDGPFDYEEVDLEADDVDRLDLGTLILTPTEGMELRLQMSEETQQVTSAMILLGDSALELTLFAAPRTGGMWADVRAEAISATEEMGGSAILAKGPFGTELRRLITVRAQDGTEGYQPSRTWVAEGPRWMLRGVVYGQASMADGIEAPADVIHDIFCNLVVRRGNDAKAPGDIVSLELPEALAAQE